MGCSLPTLTGDALLSQLHVQLDHIRRRTTLLLLQNIFA